MAHMAASWPDQVLCKENKRAALEAQHKSWMCQRDKALREQATATASNATAPEPDESHEDDELHEELQEITAFLDGVGCAIEDDKPRAAASAGDDDGDGASSFVDSDEELDDAAFARYAAARRRQLSSAAGDSGGDGRAVGDDDAQTSWATLGAASSTGVVTSRLRFWHRPANQEDLTLGATSRWSGDGTIITGVRLWPAAVGLASVLERRSRADPAVYAGVQALELGAGVGVSGIVLAELGARVTLTDCFPPILALLRRNVAQNAGGGLARRASVAHLAWEDPASLQMEPGSLDLIIGSDLIYGGPKNGALLLSAIGQLISLYGHPRTTVLLAFGCRCRGSDDHVGFLRAAAERYEVLELEPDETRHEAMAEEKDMDGVDIVELTPSAAWRP